MKSFFSRLRVRSKMSVAAALLVVPLLFLAVQFYWKVSEDIVSTKLEIKGLKYMVQLEEIVLHLQRHRGITAAPEAVPDAKKALKEEAGKVGESLEKIEKLHTISQDTLELQTQLADLKNKIDYVLGLPNSVGRDSAIKLHTDTINAVHDFADIVAEKSTLDFEPEPGTKYLSELTLKIIPPLAEALGQTRYLGSSVLAGARSPQSLQLLDSRHGIIENRIAELDQNKNRLLRHAPEAAAELASRHTSVNAAGESFLRIYVALFSRGYQGGNQRAQEFFTSATAHIDALQKLSRHSFEILGLQLQSRLLKLRTKQWSVLILTLIGISDWAFKRPVFIGDTIYVESKVIAREVRQLVGGMKAGHVTLDVQVKKQRGKICQQGKWSMLVKMKEPA